MSGATSVQSGAVGSFSARAMQLIGHATLCRDHDHQFITGFMVFFKDVNNAPDTLRIGDGSPAKFHQKPHVGSLWHVPFIYVTIRRTEL